MGLTGGIQSFDIASVYAFDNLVRNIDRGGERNKPNILVDDENYLLIDHEQIFPFCNDENDQSACEIILDDFQKNAWNHPFYKHLFFDTLKSYRSDKKINLLDEFEECLRRLNLGLISETIDQLEALKVTVGKKAAIINYLSALKQDSNKFCKQLLNTIA